MKSEKLSRMEIFQKVTYACRKRRYNITINELSKDTGIRWETIRNCVCILAFLTVLDVQGKKYNYVGLTADYFEPYCELMKGVLKIREANNFIQNLEKYRKIEGEGEDGN
jgi:hypothetical protein